MARRLLLCVLLGLGSPVSAAQPPLNLVSGNDYAPFAGSDLPAGGMLTEIVQAALAQQQVPSTVDWKPWKRGYLETLRGKYAATFPYRRSPERELEYLYSEPLYTNNPRIYSRAGEVLEPDNLAALKGKRLCVPLGYLVQADIQPMVERGEITLHTPQTLDACARLLLLQRDDFFITDAMLGDIVLRGMGKDISAFRSSIAAFSSSSLYFIVPRQNPQAKQLLETFNAGLAALRASGEYGRLIEDYQQAAR